MSAGTKTVDHVRADHAVHFEDGIGSCVCGWTIVQDPDAALSEVLDVIEAWAADHAPNECTLFDSGPCRAHQVLAKYGRADA